MNRLAGEYKEDFFEVKKYIEKFSAKGSEQDEAFESLLTIYLEAQEKKRRFLKSTKFPQKITQGKLRKSFRRKGVLT